MPSHQSRRDPLPDDYQFGDAGKPDYPTTVTLTPAAFKRLLQWMAYEHVQAGRLFSTLHAHPSICWAQPRQVFFCDMTFIEGR